MVWLIPKSCGYESFQMFLKMDIVYPEQLVNCVRIPAELDPDEKYEWWRSGVTK